jgi:hypothetical protein
MIWFAVSSWEIVLSAATPVAVALILFTLEARGPLAAALQRPLGLVGPYFTAIAILFGLFTSLLMSDVWQKDNAARQSVQVEDDTVRALLQLARINDLANLIPQLKTYVAAVSKENPYSRDEPGAREGADRAYEAMVASVSHAYGLDSSARSFILGTLGELRRARDRRLYLADDETVGIKWLSIVVLGALTQIAILVVHTGNRPAVRLSVALFTVAFTFCLVVLAVFDAPFEIVLSGEPGKTLNRTLEGL